MSSIVHAPCNEVSGSTLKLRPMLAGLLQAASSMRVTSPKCSAGSERFVPRGAEEIWFADRAEQCLAARQSWNAPDWWHRL